MSGDWIKMRSDLFTHPKVVRISSALKADRLRTVGGLMSAWCLFDTHSVDGSLHGYSPETLDSHLAWPGFSDAMIAVGWLIADANFLQLPQFDAHNGQSAKRRAMDADRKRAIRNPSASEADKKRTREEKRREEKKEQKQDQEATASELRSALSAPENTNPVPIPPEPEPEPLPDPIWRTGLAFLRRKSLPDRQARALLGKLRKAAGDIATGALLAQCEAQDITDPAPWLMAAAQRSRDGPKPVGQTVKALQILEELKRKANLTDAQDPEPQRLAAR